MIEVYRIICPFTDDKRHEAYITIDPNKRGYEVKCADCKNKIRK